MSKSKAQAHQTSAGRTEGSQQQHGVGVRYRPTLSAFVKVVKALEPLRDEERRRVINASAVATGVDAILFEAHPNAGADLQPRRKE